MNDELQQQLDSLARDECYRVDAVLKNGQLERTERVFFVGQNGSEQGPYIRKYFDCEAGLGGAYRRILEAQRQGSRFLHLPRIFDCYSVGEQDAVVMECVPGKTLADVVHECDPSVELANRLFPPVCNAVRELHERFNPPLIHRDIKPSNFMVEGNAVFVIDLGIARTFDADATTDTKHFGTRAYAPPEQFGYGQTDERSDVYALGMLLFYLLCEVTPEVGCVEAELEKHGVPEALRSVVAQATSFDPANRFQSVTALRAAFQAAVSQPSAGSEVADVRATCSPMGSQPSPIVSAQNVDEENVTTPNVRSAMRFEALWNHGRMLGHKITEAFQHQGSTWHVSAFPASVQSISLRVKSLSTRIPLGVGIVWDTLIVLWDILLAAMCANSTFHPVGDVAQFSGWARAVIYSLTWILLASPTALVLDVRPFRNTLHLKLEFRFRWRLLVFVTSFLGSAILITFLNGCFAPAP